MSHKYVCEQCGATKECGISGCDGDCVKLCVLCLRKKTQKEKVNNA